MGAAWPGLVASGFVLVGGLVTRRLPRILLWLAFAIVTTALVTAAKPDMLQLAGAATVAILAVTPLAVTLGDGAPTRRMLAVPAVAASVTGIFFLTPPGAALFSSDLAVGATIVALASGLVIASSLPSITTRWSR